MWTMLDREVNRFSKYAGTFAFGWRIILTTGTGSIFGFLVASREAYATAIPCTAFHRYVFIIWNSCLLSNTQDH